MSKLSPFYISLLFFILPVINLHGQVSHMIKVEKLSINTNQFNEIAAVPVSGGIVFCSDRRISGVVNNKTFDGDRVYNIFYAEREDTMKWGQPGIFSKDLQTLFNQGPFCFSPDGRQIYYTSDVERGNNAFERDFKNRRGILIAEKTADGWSEPVAFEYNDPLWNTGHPCLSIDGNYLFFSSDRPGGFGGSDIYMCRRQDNKWTEPENLGPEINGTGSELYPCFTAAGELYYASDREGGIGGLDIYSSRMISRGWTKPVLLPEPVNSSDDDFSLAKRHNSTEGFFASNRGRSDDIYMYSSSIRRMSECNELVYDSYCWEFEDENSAKADSMTFVYEWDFDDGTVIETTETRAEHCFSQPGVYLVKLHAIDTITGEVRRNEATYLLEVKRTEQAFITAPDTCFAGEAVSIDASGTYLPDWDIESYYWNFDDGTAAQGMSNEKIYLLEGSYDVQLIISSFPDAEGNIREICVTRTIVVKRR
ncbi:MAG: PKD domain-containing protein [Bacteroidales bacterium]|nr:PKD domain-containing protein [Bacteroidales bacterium]